MMRQIFLLTLLLLITSSCTVLRKQQPTKASIQSAELFEYSKRDLKNGRERDASEKLQQIVRAEPNSDLADDAAIELGHLYFKDQDYERAYDHYMMVVNSNVFSPSEVDALYFAAKCLYFLNRFDAAASLLEKSLRLDPIPLSTKVQIHELLFNVLSQQGDLIDGLLSLSFLFENHPQQKTKYLNQGISILETQLAEKELEYLAGRSAFHPFQGYAMAFLAEKSLALRDFEKAARYYSGVIEFLPNSEWADKGRTFLERRAAQKKVDPLTIGVVLPLTGRHSRFADKTLRGIQLALGVFGEPNSPYKLAVIDSEGNPDIAKRGVERLVLEDHVIAIIGSLLSRTADAVSRTAHEFGIPSIALSQKAGVTETGDSVFRNSLTSEMQIKHLVQFAMNEMGMKKFAILFPNDQYGVEYANLFWDHVLTRGGQITASQAYKPKETDFKNSIRRLVGTFYIDDRLEEYKYRLKEWQKQNTRFSLRHDPPEDLLPPIIDFDAIFIPDGTKALGQIAPMLQYNDVNNVYLLGTNLWNSKSVISRSSNMSSQVVFVDTFTSSAEAFQNSSFYQHFQQTFASTPGHFETQAYDSARLLREIIESGARDRQDIIHRLQSMKSYTGVSGVLKMTPNREIEPPLVTLSVKNNSIQKIDASLRE